MRLKLWGVRGSLPSPLSPEYVHQHVRDTIHRFDRARADNPKLGVDEFLAAQPPHLRGGYGGNTSCGEITHGDTRLLIDCGSGLRAFSDMIMKTEPKTQEFHVYLTHFHWDHLIGLPFFVPVYMKGKTIHFYSPHDDLEESLKVLFRKPHFPVPYEVVASQIRTHRVAPREPFRVGELTITPYRLDHPDPSWGARVEAGGKAIAWAVDSECTRTSREELGPDYRLYQNADLMVFDAQYTFEEALEKMNWGHSSGPVGIDLAIRENVKRALFMHHDPSASDAAIRRAEEDTIRYYEELVRARLRAGLPHPGLEWRFAQEGETVEL